MKVRGYIVFLRMGIFFFFLLFRQIYILSRYITFKIFAIYQLLESSRTK